MSKQPLVYISHIHECIIKIKKFTEGFEEKSFLENELVQDGVIRNFEVIGEATKQLDKSFKQKYPEIEWKKIAGMRDKLIHDYIGVDLWAVWAVVENVLPEFQEQIEHILSQEKKA